MTELGKQLREARLNKNLTLDDLQEMTKIQKRYLKGIEEGNYDMMPGPFYVRAFIKQYAEAVGLEPEEIFEVYKSEIPTTMNEDIPEKLSRVQSRKNISYHHSKVFDILPKIVVAIFIIGILAVIWYFWWNKAEEQPNETINNQGQETIYEQTNNVTPTEEKEEDIVDDEEPLDTTEEENEVVVPEAELKFVNKLNHNSSEYELINAETFELKLVTINRSWVSVKNGQGKNLYQGELNVNTTDTYTVDMTEEGDAVIRIGSSPNTEIYVNNIKLEYEIPPNEQHVQNITIRFQKNNAEGE